MSSPRYGWWSYVKGIIRRYPLLKEQHDDLCAQQLTASYSGVPGTKQAKRVAELSALRSTVSDREYDAVYEAIEATMLMQNGSLRIYLIDLVFWKGTHTIAGAAQECFVSERTAREWHRQFIRLVAVKYGLLE